MIIVDVEQGKMIGYGDYEIVVTKLHSHSMSFEVYRIIGKKEDGTPAYNRKDYETSPDFVEDRKLAQVETSGFIKWDGCLDITIEDEPLHFCSKSDLQEYCAMLAFLYDVAEELIYTET